MVQSIQQDILQEGIFLLKIGEDSKIVDCNVMIFLYIRASARLWSLAFVLPILVWRGVQYTKAYLRDYCYCLGGEGAH